MNETKEVKTFSDIWWSNYTGQTEISKSIMSRLKKTYKGDAYIPWAQLVTALYMLDPDAEIIKCQNGFEGYVFTDSCELRLVKQKEETIQSVFSHMVKVRVKFMGKWFEESYPVQDNSYSAPKNYDQNMVNKALQRCLARTISMATGIGWSLYEQVEAQFEDDGKKADVQLMPTPTTTETVVDTTPPTEVKATGNPVDDLVALMVANKDKDATTKIVANFNVVLPTQYKFNNEPLTLDLENDTPEVLKEKLLLVKKPDKMLANLSKALGVKLND